MKKLNSKIRPLLILIIFLSFNAEITAQSAEFSSVPTPADIEKMKPVIESRDKQFSAYFLAGDSSALANMYTTDAQFGTVKGPEILPALGSWIRNSIKNDTRHLTFKINTLNGDGEFLIETGTAETRNDKGDLKYSSRYLVVWKQEDGSWKLYRDIGL